MALSNVSPSFHCISDAWDLFGLTASQLQGNLMLEEIMRLEEMGWNGEWRRRWIMGHWVKSNGLNLFPLNVDVIYFSSRTKNLGGGASRVMFRC